MSSTVAEKRKIQRLPRAERIEAITAAACDAFAEHGYEGAVMAEIAHAAGIAESTIYKLFENKRDLLDRVMSEWYRGFTEDLDLQLQGLDDPVQKLRFVIWRHLHVIKSDPALCRVFFREIRSHDNYSNSATSDLNRRYTALTVGVIEDGIERGVFRDDVPVSLVRDTIFGGLEHYAWQYLSGRKPLDVDQATNDFWRLILRGIRAENNDGQALAQRLEQVADRLEAAT